MEIFNATLSEFNVFEILQITNLFILISVLLISAIIITLYKIQRFCLK